MEKFIFLFYFFFRKINKGPRLDDTILKDQNLNQEFMLPNFMTYYKAAVIKTVCYRYKDRQYRSVKQKRGANISLFVYSVNFQ